MLPAGRASPIGSAAGISQAVTIGTLLPIGLIVNRFSGPGHRVIVENVIVGEGILVLTAANTFTGLVSVNAGTVTLSGGGTLTSTAAINDAAISADHIWTVWL